MRELEIAERIGALTPTREVRAAAAEAVSALRNAFALSLNDSAAVLAHAFNIEPRLVRPYLKAFEKNGLEAFARALVVAELEVGRCLTSLCSRPICRASSMDAGPSSTSWRDLPSRRSSSPYRNLPIGIASSRRSREVRFQDRGETDRVPYLQRADGLPASGPSGAAGHGEGIRANR